MMSNSHAFAFINPTKRTDLFRKEDLRIAGGIDPIEDVLIHMRGNGSAGRWCVISSPAQDGTSRVE
jgi:hypothetical protein